MAEVKEIEIKFKGLRQIKSELDAINEALEEATDPKSMAQLTMEASKLGDELSNAEHRMTEFRQSGQDAMSNVGESLGQLGESVMKMDFKGIESQVGNLAKSAGKITFKSAIGSVKSLGKTFLSLGKALLSNPLFLLSAIITAIVVAVYKFLDSLGYIDKAMQMLMKPIQYIIDLFYDLTDAMGLTNVAAQKLADETAKAFSDTADLVGRVNGKMISGLDHEIRMNLLAGKSVDELGKKRVDAAEATAKANMDRDKALYRAAEINKDLTKEEIKAIYDTQEASKAAYKQAVRDTDYYEAQVVKTKNDERTKDNKAQDDANKTASDKRKANAEKRKADEEKAEQDRIAKEKQYASDRLSAKRLQEDLDLELTKEGVDKEVALNKLKYDRLIEDTETNEKLNADEKLRVKAQYEKLATQQELKLIDDSNKVIADAKKQAQADLNALLFDLTATDTEKAIAQVTEANQVKLDALKTQFKDKEEYAAAEIALEEDTADKIKAINQDVEDKARAARRESISDWLGIASQGIDAISSLMQTSMDNEIKSAEGNSVKQEQLRKKAFEQQKKMQIAAAFINMAQGIVAGLGAPFPMNIAMPIMAGITGIASIAKIKSTTYSGGGSASAPSTPSVSMPTAPDRGTPNFNFQGTGGNSNEQSAGTNIVIQNEVKVSETEITDKQKTVTNYTNSAKL